MSAKSLGCLIVLLIAGTVCLGVGAFYQATFTSNPCYFINTNTSDTQYVSCGDYKLCSESCPNPSTLYTCALQCYVYGNADSGCGGCSLVKNVCPFCIILLVAGCIMECIGLGMLIRRCMVKSGGGYAPMQ